MMMSTKFQVLWHIVMLNVGKAKQALLYVNTVCVSWDILLTRTCGKTPKNWMKQRQKKSHNMKKNWQKEIKSTYRHEVAGK